MFIQSLFLLQVSYLENVWCNTVFTTSIFSQVQTPVVIVDSNTATTISLSWADTLSVVKSYEVMWERDTSGDCPNVDANSTTLTGDSANYTIAGLEEDSNYTITVTVTAANVVGSAVSNPVTGMTVEAGEGLTHMS